MVADIDAGIARLIDVRIIHPGQLKGCSEGQLAAIERAHGFPLPGAYRRFLAVMGVSAGRFLTGTDFLFPDLLELRAAATNLLQDCGGTLSLRPNHLVFLMHQGYQFLFMETGGSDDPEVFRFLEGDESFTSVADSFSRWFADCVADETAPL